MYHLSTTAIIHRVYVRVCGNDSVEIEAL